MQSLSKIVTFGGLPPPLCELSLDIIVAKVILLTPYVFFNFLLPKFSTCSIVFKKITDDIIFLGFRICLIKFLPFKVTVIFFALKKPCQRDTTWNFWMAGAEGLEPSAYGFGDHRSTSWAIPLWGDLWESNPRISEPQSDVLTTSPRPPLNTSWLWI